MRDLLRQIAENRIVLEEVRERLRIRNVIHRYNLNVLIAERRPRDVPADAAKPIDPNFNWHASSQIFWRLIPLDGMG